MNDKNRHFSIHNTLGPCISLQFSIRNINYLIMLIKDFCGNLGSLLCSDCITKISTIYTRLIVIRCSLFLYIYKNSNLIKRKL